jgi:hypothetical protein
VRGWPTLAGWPSSAITARRVGVSERIGTWRSRTSFCSARESRTDFAHAVSVRLLTERTNKHEAEARAAASSATKMAEVATPGEQLPRRGARSGLPWALTALVAVLLLLVAFSTDIIEGVTATIDPNWDQDVPRLPRILTIPVDALLLAWAVVLGRRCRFEAGCGDTPATTWIVVGIAGVLLADGVFVLGREVSVPVDVLVSLVYLPMLYCVWSGVLGIDPVRPLRSSRQRTSAEPCMRRSLAAVVPLLIGVGAAYVGETLYWREVQVGGDHIDQEYFAQISQVLPLLAIALGFESRFTDSGRELYPAELAVGMFTVLLLVVGEGLAISALPVDNNEVFLYTWHEYVAFIVTLYACFVALAVLVAVLVVSLKPGGSRAVE